jgi:hypothetical protein
MQLVEMMIESLGGEMRVRPGERLHIELDLPSPSLQALPADWP